MFNLNKIIAVSSIKSKEAIQKPIVTTHTPIVKPPIGKPKPSMGKPPLGKPKLILELPFEGAVSTHSVPNIGGSCFLISAIQGIARVPFIREIVKEESERREALRVQKLFAKEALGELELETIAEKLHLFLEKLSQKVKDEDGLRATQRDLWDAVAAEPGYAYLKAGSQDAADFVNALLSILQIPLNLETTITSLADDDLYRPELKQLKSNGYILEISANPINIQEAIMDCQSAAIVEDKTNYEKTIPVARQTIFSGLPPFLFVRAKNLPEVAKGIAPSTEIEVATSEGFKQMTLKAIIRTHSDGGGHYSTLVKEADDNWYSYDDNAPVRRIGPNIADELAVIKHGYVHLYLPA
jgi:hypothetical protein